MASEAFPTLISELTSSICDGDRLKTKTRFEEQCKVLDYKLNHLVKEHNSRLSTILSYTSTTIEVIANSKNKCQFLKERLTSVKNMLQCKRDDLRRLWLESIQHKYVHQMLDEIVKLRKIPQTVNDSLLSKKYIEATQILVSSISMLEGRLCETEALKDLKAELHRLMDKFYSIFLEELCQELYMSTFHSVFQSTYDPQLEDVTYDRVFKCKILRESSKSINFNVSYITTLMECISLLGKIPETLEILKEECHNELMRIIHKLSKLMFDVIQRSTDIALLDLSLSHQQTFLIDLLDTIIGHFRQIAINNKIFLHILGKTVLSTLLEESCYQTVDLYSNMQEAIEQFVTGYLEIQPLTTLTRQNTMVFSNSQIVSDLSSFFMPKGHSESKCQTLFKFKNSSQGMIRNRKKAKYEHLIKTDEFGGQDNTSELNLRKLVLICKPSVRNITLLFNSLKSFIVEIEMALDLELGMHCPLHVYLFDCTNHFLDQVNSEINRILETASLHLESWTISVVPDDQGNSDKQILSSTLILNEHLKELQILLSRLPDYSSHFLQLIYYVILDYKDLVHKAFKSLFDEEQNILSVSWAKDRDIRRLLKSFSNWKHLEDAESVEVMESPEEIRMRNKEESELLIRNLNSEEQSSWEIISDYSILFHLALLQESLQWFSVQMIQFIEDFNYIPSDAAISEANSELSASRPATDLKKLAKEYEDFSDVCLLALHLEVRAHCFHHLLSVSSDEEYAESNVLQDLEISVQKLTADLIKIDETLLPCLTAKELKYIFEGLGELIASILIYNVSNLSKVNESLVKRLHRSIFILQCCLGNITMTREVSLERARQYIQLLNQTGEEILTTIVEEGPKFKEQEYISLLRLIWEKDRMDYQLLNEYIIKLRKLFKRDIETS